MPTYCFVEPKSGHTMELTMSISEMERQSDGDYLQWGGTLWKRHYQSEMNATTESGCAAWPMKSDAAGVHPEQAVDFMKDASKKGVPTEFDTRTGQAIFSNRAHRSNYLKAMGMHDRNGGYGD